MNSKTFHCQNEKRQLAAGVFFDLKNNEVGGLDWWHFISLFYCCKCDKPYQYFILMFFWQILSCPSCKNMLL